jgi:prophage regulatory protein
LWLIVEEFCMHPVLPDKPSTAPSDSPLPTFLRLPSVMRMTGLGRSTIYRLVAEKSFPCPVRLGPRAVAWRRSDLDQWSSARPNATH